MGKAGQNSKNEETETLLALHPTAALDVGGQWGIFGTLATSNGSNGVAELGSTADFCHVVLLSPVELIAGVGAAREKSYEFDRGCHGEEPSLRLVGLNNAGGQINKSCRVELGNEGYELGAQPSSRGAIDERGDEVFYTECVGPEEATGSHQLFVRLAGARTLEVSRPVGGCVGAASSHSPGEVPCAGAVERASANFVGASGDGSTVFFTAPLAPGQPPLVPGDEDHSDNLYMATIGCPAGAPACEPGERELVSQVQVSRDPNGGAAEVQGVVRVAPDGRRVYFVARGDLLGQSQRQALETEGKAVPQAGAANLYAYDSVEDSLAFVGDLCSGKDLSGSVEDYRCPSSGSDASLWSGNVSEAQAAGAEGGFLVFGSYAQLTPDDANAAEDVYRYDAATGGLTRVSTGEGGADANGNLGPGASVLPTERHGDRVRQQYEMENRAVSEDGSQIVFVSKARLSEAASNGLSNAYLWSEGPGRDEGRVSLISSGSSEQPVGDVVISPRGSSVFFETVDGLVPQDTDGAPDIYDARLDGGFPQPLSERRPCEGDACQGPLSNPAPLFVPGSVPQAPGGNFVAEKPAGTTKKVEKKHRRKARGRHTRRCRSSSGCRGARNRGSGHRRGRR
jgi:hypothetical protein